MMRARQDAVSTPMRAYYPYVSKGRGNATKYCIAYSSGLSNALYKNGKTMQDASKTRRGEGAYKWYVTEPQQSIATHILQGLLKPSYKNGKTMQDASKTRRGEGAYKWYVTEPQRCIATQILRFTIAFG